MFVIDCYFGDIFVIKISWNVLEKKLEKLKFMGFWFTSLFLDGHTGYLWCGALKAIGYIP